MEQEKLRANLIIQGIVETSTENCVEVISSFFENMLGVKDIKIVKAYRVGKGKSRPMKVILSKAADKGLIYKNVKKLQGKKNINNRYYRIEDELLPKESEERKKNRDFMWRNKKQTVADKILESMEIKKKSLMIGGNPRTALIKTPDRNKLLKLQKDETCVLESTPVVKGTAVEKEGSSFTGYVCDVQNQMEVNQAFEYVRFHNMGARHIICACILPGTYVTDRYDYYDDNEHSAGVSLLNYMIDANLENRVIFIVREYDGTHISPDRFDCIISAAKKAVNFKPYNSTLNDFQFSWPKARSITHPENEVASTTSEPSSDESEVLLGSDQNGTEWAERVPEASREDPAQATGHVQNNPFETFREQQESW